VSKNSVATGLLITLGVVLLLGGSCAGLIGLSGGGGSGILILLAGMVAVGGGIVAIVFAARK